MKNTKRLITLIVLLAVCLFSLVACSPVELSAPFVTLDGNVVKWLAVSNAVSYDVHVGDDVVNVTDTSYTVDKTAYGSYDITVVAKGDGDDYLDSKPSNKVTYVVAKPEPVKLTAPTISLTGNVVSWTPVENAVSYDVYVNDTKVGNALTTTEYTLAETAIGSYKIQVVAVGDGELYLNSDKSAHQTYVISATILDAPILSVQDNVVSWSAIENATGYVVIVNGTPQSEATTQTSYTVDLTVGLTTIKVVAVTTDAMFEDSAPSNPVTVAVVQLGAPVISIDSDVINQIVWTAVTNATSYDVYVNDEFVQNISTTYFNLGEKAVGTYNVKVVAKSQSVIVLDSEKSNQVTYSVAKLGTPVVTLEGNVVSWTPVANASGYRVTVGDLVMDDKQLGTSYTLAEGLAVGAYDVTIQAVGNGLTFLDGDKSAVATYTVSNLEAPVVTISGKVASWTAVQGAVSYDVYVNNGNAINVTATNYTFDATTVGTQTIQVVAKSDKVWLHDSAKSAVATFVVEQLDAPVISLSDKTITWEPVANAQGYKVYMYNPQGSFDVVDDLLATLDSATCTYTVTSTQEGVHALSVVALGNNVNYLDSNPASMVTITIQAPAGPLATPVISVQGNVVSWDRVDNASSYDVYFDGEKVGSTNSSTRTFTIDTADFTDTTTIQVTVKAIAPQDSTKFLDSAMSEATGYTITKLATPVVTIDKNVISWSAIENATGYVVYVDNVPCDPITATTYTITKTSPADYNVVVKAKGDGKVVLIDSDLSNKVVYSLVELSAPANLAVNGGIVTWDAVANATSYVISVGDYVVENVTATSYALSLAEITAGTYTLSVVAVGDGISYLTGPQATVENFVVEPIVENLTVDFADNFKGTYYLHEGIITIDATGLTLNVSCLNADDGVVDISDVTVSNYDLTTVGEKVITLTFNGRDAEIIIYVEQMELSQVTDYQTLVIEYNSTDLYATEYTILNKLDGTSVLTDGNINLPMGETMLYNGEAFVLAKVAYLVADAAAFQAIANDMDGYYILTGDINFGDLVWHRYDQIGLAPLTSAKRPTNGDVGEGGQVGVAFTGTLDGQGYAIKNFHQELRDGEATHSVISYGVAIFGWLGESGVIRNLTLDNVSIHAGGFSSLLVGYNQGLIENIMVEANCYMYDHYNAGSILCSFDDGTVRNVVSYLTKYHSYYGDKIHDATIAHDSEENPSVVENGFVGNTDDNTALLGKGWQYFDGIGTMLVNDHFVRITTTATTLPLGTSLNLETIYTTSDSFEYKFYSVAEGDTTVWTDFVAVTFEQGVHTLSFVENADISALVGKQFKLIILNNGWAGTDDIVITIAEPVITGYVTPEIAPITITQGETISTSLINITVNYSYGESSTINPTAIEFDSTQEPGTYTATYLYGDGQSGTFQVILQQASAPVVNQLVVNASTQQIDYQAGESLVDLINNAVTFKLAMSNDSQVDVDDLSKITVDIGGRVAGVVPATFTYTDGAVVKTATVDFTVWYNVATTDDWNLISSDLNGYYRLANDLDFSAITSWWTYYGIGKAPLTADKVPTAGDVGQGGQVGSAFNGIFDGNGFAIVGFKQLVRESESASGVEGYGRAIFGWLGESGIIRHLTLRNVTIGGGKHTSLLVGYNQGLVQDICVEENCTLNSSYNGAAIISAYNHGTVQRVVSYMTTFVGWGGNTNNAYMCVNEEANKYLDTDGNYIKDMVGEAENCYIGNTSDLTAVLGAKWKYVDGTGTVLQQAQAQESL